MIFAQTNATQSQKEQPAAHHAETTRHLRQRLAAAGLRLTRQREAILRILEDADEHMDAATLLQQAKAQVNIDRATVYRTLELLKKNGLIDELDLMHLRGEMHYFEARSAREHFHLACLGCGEIREVEHSLFEALKHEIEKTEGFAIETARLEVGGYCTACREKKMQAGDSLADAKLRRENTKSPGRSLLAKRCPGSEIDNPEAGD